MLIRHFWRIKFYASFKAFHIYAQVGLVPLFISVLQQHCRPYRFQFISFLFTLITIYLRSSIFFSALLEKNYVNLHLITFSIDVVNRKKWKFWFDSFLPWVIDNKGKMKDNHKISSTTNQLQKHVYLGSSSAFYVTSFSTEIGPNYTLHLLKCPHKIWRNKEEINWRKKDGHKQTFLWRTFFNKPMVWSPSHHILSFLFIWSFDLGHCTSPFFRSKDAPTQSHRKTPKIFSAYTSPHNTCIMCSSAHIPLCLQFFTLFYLRCW